ncbi:MAG: hypothetical protein WCJ63_08430, partial [Actinomycetes bacterium]
MKGLLETMMPMAVFLRIKTLEKQGGPAPEDMAKIQETSDMLGEHGDVLLHGRERGGHGPHRAELRPPLRDARVLGAAGEHERNGK